MSWKDIKGIWNKDARIEAIIDAQRLSYAAYKRRFPDYDATADMVELMDSRNA